MKTIAWLSILIAVSSCMQDKIVAGAVVPGPGSDAGLGDASVSDAGTDRSDGGQGPIASFCWAVRVSSGEGYLTDMAGFADGSFAITGWVNGSADARFAPDDPAALAPPECADGSGFIARYRSDGALLWVRFVGPGLPGRVVALGDADVLVLGRFLPSADPDCWRDARPTSSTMARYDADGSLVWSDVYTNGDAPSNVPVSGHIHDDRVASPWADGSFITAASVGGTVILDPAEGSRTVVSACDGGVDCGAFIARYGASGALEWARSVLEGAVSARAMAVQPDGTSMLLAAERVPDDLAPVHFLLSDATGSVLRDRIAMSNARISARVLPAPDGAFVVAGSFYGRFAIQDDQDQSIVFNGPFDPASASDVPALFALGLSSQGHLSWVIGLESADLDNIASVGAADALADGRFVVSGRLAGQVRFEAGATIDLQGSRSSEGKPNDFYLARYTPQGAIEWAARGSPGKKALSVDVTALTARPAEGPVLGGVFRGSLSLRLSGGGSAVLGPATAAQGVPFLAQVCK